MMGAALGEEREGVGMGDVHAVDAGGFSHQNSGGRESLEEGTVAGYNFPGPSTDSLDGQRKTFVFGNRPLEATTPQAPRNNNNDNRNSPSDGHAIFAGSSDSRNPRRSILQRRRDAAAAAVLGGGGRRQSGTRFEETEDEGKNTATNDEGDDPFTASEGRDLVRALRFRRNLPPSAAMYLLSKMESRSVARLRVQVLREYKETMGRSWPAPGGGKFGDVGEAAPASTSLAHIALGDAQRSSASSAGSLDAFRDEPEAARSVRAGVSRNAGSSNNQSPPIVAPIARRRGAPPGSELVPTAPLQNSPLMLPPPPRGGEFLKSHAGAGARGASESRDGVRSRAPYERRSSVAGGEMLAPRVTRGGDPDGLLTPAHKARATARRQSLREQRSFAHSTPGGDRVWQPAATANQGTPWAGAPRTHVRGEGSGGAPRSRVHEEPPAVGGDDIANRRTPARYSLGSLRSPAAMARRVISLLDDAASLRTPLRLSPPSANPTTVIEDVAVQPDTAYAEEGRLPTKMLSVPYPNTKVDPGAGNDGRDKERKARLASPAAKLPPSRWARREIQTQTDDGLIGSGGRGSGGGGSSSASPSPRRQSRKRKTDEYVQDDEGKDASAPAGEGEGGKEMEVDGRKPTAVGTQMSPAAVVGMAGVADDVESTGISPHRNKRARTNSEVLLDQQLKQGRGNDADGGHAANDGRKQDTRSSIDRDGKDKSSAEVTTGGDGDKKNDDGDLAASETPKRPNDSSADGAERRREAHGTDRHLGGKSPYVRGDGGMKPRPYRSAAAGGVRFTDSEAQQAPTKLDYWTCRGCYVRIYDMDAKECDMCLRPKNFGTPYYKQPRAVLANGRTLHNVRINLEAAKMSTPARSTPAAINAAPTIGSGPVPGSEPGSAVATGGGSTPKATSVRFSSDTKGFSPTPTPTPTSTAIATATATAAPSLTPTPAAAPATPGPGFSFAASRDTSLSTPAPVTATPSTPAFSFGSTAAAASAGGAAAAPAPAVSDPAAASAARPAKRTAFQFSAPASTAAGATAPADTAFGTAAENPGFVAVAAAQSDKATSVTAAPAPASATAGFTFGSTASKTPSVADVAATAAAAPAATAVAPGGSTTASFTFGGTSSSTSTAAKTSPAASGAGVTAAPTASSFFKSGTDAPPKSPPKSKGAGGFTSFAAPTPAPVAPASSTAGFTFGAAAAAATSGAALAPVPAATPAPAPAASPFLFGGAAPAPAVGATAVPAAAPAAGATGASTGLAMPAPTTFPVFGTAAFGSTVGGVRAPSPAGSVGGFGASGQGAPKRGASPAGSAGGFGPSGQGAPKRGGSLANTAFGGGAAGAFGAQPGATGLFGAAGADASAAPQATAGGFSFGAAAAPSATGFSVQPPSTQFGTTAPAAGTATGGFVGVGAAGGFPPVAGAAPVVRPPANAGGAFNLGAQQAQPNTNKAGRRMVKGRRPKKR
ncbi:unnamed protein product [Sphacelaria rigidula]